MLYGNPHFPWSGSERFFQSQLTIPGKINVSGASLLGSPVIQIGHTQNVAWSHTVSTARRFNFFRETLVPGDPTKYLVDGQPTADEGRPTSRSSKGNGDDRNPDPLLDQARSDLELDPEDPAVPVGNRLRLLAVRRELRTACASSTSSSRSTAPRAWRT